MTARTSLLSVLPRRLFNAFVVLLAMMLVAVVAPQATAQVESPTSSGEASTVDTPIVRVPFANKKPTIDGVMNEGEWEDASALTGFWYDFAQNDFRYLASQHSQVAVYLSYDKDNLYVAYDTVVYPEGSWLKARGRFPDVLFHPQYGTLWDDHIELEIRPIADNVEGFRLGLFKWILNPLDTTADYHWSLAGGENPSWQSKAQVRSNVTDKKWTQEIAIPLSSFREAGYAANGDNGQPLVQIPPPDGTTYRAWFTRAIGGNGEFFNAWDKHQWNTTKTKLIFDSQAPSFKVTDLGPIMDDIIDVTVQVKNHSAQSQTVRLGFFVESAEGLIYSSYNDPQLQDGLLELVPGEVRDIRLQQPLPGISTNGNVLWFDVRSAGQPAKVLFRTRLVDFHSMEGGVVDDESYRERRVDNVAALRPPRKDFDFRHNLVKITRSSPVELYVKRIAGIVDVGIAGASEEAKNASEARLLVLTDDDLEDIVAEGRAEFKGDFATFLMDVPDLVKDESYKLALLLFDENRRIVGEETAGPFRYREPTWKGNDLGLGDVVWEPFVPMELADGGFETLKHRFTLDASGLPAQIFIKPDERELPLEKRSDPSQMTDSELLAMGRGPQLRAPLRLEAIVDGTRVPAEVVEPAKLVRQWKSELEYQSRLKAGPIDITLTAQYDCDGAMHLNLDYQGQDGQAVDGLELVGDLAGVFDLVTSANRGGGMTGNDKWECTLPAGEGIVWDSVDAPKQELFYSRFVPWLFVGTGDRGFTYFCDSDRGWAIDKEGSTMTLERNEDGDLTWRAKLVNHRTELNEPRSIELTWLTHPSKPKPENYRKIAWFFRGDVWAEGYQQEPVELSEEYLKQRAWQAAGAPQDMPYEEVVNYRDDTPPHRRYGRWRNIGIWPEMDQFFEDKAVYYLEQQIRIGRRVGWWWDEYWPTGFTRTSDIADGDAYLRDPETIDENELPWQDGYLQTHLRDTFKRLARVFKSNNVPQRSFVWANNSATLLESTAYDTQLVEEAGAGHRSYELDVVVQFPNSLYRYMAHNYTGLVSRIVIDDGILPAGDDPIMERQLYGRALLNNIGVCSDGPHGRTLQPLIPINLLSKLNGMGMFNDDVEVVPFWRNRHLISYGIPAGPDDAFSTSVQDPVSQAHVTVYRRPFEKDGRKGVQAMIVIMNESNEDLRENLYISNPARVFGGPNKLTVGDVTEGYSFENIPENSDWRRNKVFGSRELPVQTLKDIETGNIVSPASSKGLEGEVYGPVFVPRHDFRVLYGYWYK